MDGSKIPETGPLTLRLNTARYRALAAERGWKTVEEQARGLQLSMATASRIRAGLQTPGTSLICALRRAFPDEQFEDLFEVVGVEAQQGAA
ncbi:MAG: hypothetical protein JWN52_6627 [Actinomycetia bacterium]|nr:hypothetical protein [Actinomycetes bacterium]